MLLVYADRYEGFSAVVASTQSGIPTAHIEGGDITEGGALDDSVRHAMTKLAHIHFTTNQQATNRIINMGEEPWRVHTVGFPMIDLLNAGEYQSEKKVLKLYKLDPLKPIIVFTQHSVATYFRKAMLQLTPSLNALQSLSREGVQIIITYPNNDAGGRKIFHELQNFITTNQSNIQLHQSLGRYNFHGLLALAKNTNIKIACVGNSSSGIKETPAFSCPTVNIGTRQKGRLRAENVLDANYNIGEIKASIEKALFDKNFRQICRSCKNPYGQGGVGDKITNIISRIPIDDRLLVKRMTLTGNE